MVLGQLGFQIIKKKKKKKLEFTTPYTKIISSELSKQIWKPKLKISEDNIEEYFLDLEVCKVYKIYDQSADDKWKHEFCCIKIRRPD